MSRKHSKDFFLPTTPDMPILFALFRQHFHREKLFLGQFAVSGQPFTSMTFSQLKKAASRHAEDA
jgi:hypothetical protein